MAYTSTTLALVMAELLAHVRVGDFDPDTPPALVYMRATLPETSVRTIAQIGAKLPRGGDDVPAPAMDGAVGDKWIATAASLALVVPSVHVAATPERNVLINPLHPGFQRVTVRVNAYSYDRRLLVARASAERPRRKRR